MAINFKSCIFLITSPCVTNRSGVRLETRLIETYPQLDQLKGVDRNASHTSRWLAVATKH